MKSSTSFLAKIGVAAGALIGALALSVAAQTWAPAPSTPPGGNTPAPINVGLSAQAKTGLLGLSAFQFNPGGASNIATGSVMTATDSFGDVGWSPASAAGGVSQITAGTGVTISPSTGTGNVTINAVPTVTTSANSGTPTSSGVAGCGSGGHGCGLGAGTAYCPTGSVAIGLTASGDGAGGVVYSLACSQIISK